MHTCLSRMRPLVVVGMLALAACQPTDKNPAPTGVVAKAMDEAAKGLGQASQEMDKAREEIATARDRLARENISLNRNEKQHLPKAEITPAGDLLIEGKAVATTPEQKALVLAYRGELLGVVGDGMAIGMEGARVGIDAAASALKGSWRARTATRSASRSASRPRPRSSRWSRNCARACPACCPRSRRFPPPCPSSRPTPRWTRPTWTTAAMPMATATGPSEVFHLTRAPHRA
ncbi:hypothetical protein MUU75_02855 [Pseudoxanthomonas mexicana]|uniref:hypothetical protein n=1 Tax=Pseudoxanthomonas mexicana TaxID=128785 RepID=UPI001FD6E699|nr:hypothetical protein [Pseudoxanthomonas mexicana]UOV05677.1 hypothetical protein MUU75_02855 [Pseudoxanthomonas mexicana]